MRKEHDGNECQKNFKELGVEGCTVDQFIRLWKRGDDGRDRPMMVKMSSERGKWTILSRAKKLMNSSEQMRKVYINRDMTQEERAVEYHLQVMLEKRRKGEHNWKIRRGKLVDEVRRVEEGVGEISRNRGNVSRTF